MNIAVEDDKRKDGLKMCENSPSHSHVAYDMMYDMMI